MHRKAPEKLEKVKCTADLSKQRRYLAVLQKCWGKCSLYPRNPVQPVQSGSTPTSQNITFVYLRSFPLKALSIAFYVIKFILVRGVICTLQQPNLFLGPGQILIPTGIILTYLEHCF